MKKIEQFEQPDWVEALRETGAEAFAEVGLPTPADEHWKYSSLRPYERVGFEVTDKAPTVFAGDLPEKDFDQRLVFVNGVFVESLSDYVSELSFVNLSKGLNISGDSFQETMVDVGHLTENPLKADNTAHITDGVAIVLEEGQKIEKPIEVLYYTTDKALEVSPQTYTRNVFVLRKGASMQVFEKYEGFGCYAANHAVDITLEEDANLKQYRLQNDTQDSYHFANTRVMQHAKSSYKTVTMTRGARFSRHDIQALLLGAHVSCKINGLYMLRGAQHTDTKILVDHMEPHGTSSQLYKGILDDQTRAVFQGKVHVRRPAQRTDGRQLNHAILLSEQAEIDAKPELEIYADDVECAHGCTSGALDEDPLFYMQSRGIPKDQARALLMKSYLADVIEHIECDTMRSVFQKHIENWLSDLNGGS